MGSGWGAFFTGTPVSNTLAEFYILQLYLNPGRLDQLDLVSFDAWAAQFVDWVTRVEIAPDGGSYRMHTRPARFMNCPELRRRFSDFADVWPKESFDTGAPRAPHPDGHGPTHRRPARGRPPPRGAG
jgi:N12 class adenine-specific DNA methylase